MSRGRSIGLGAGAALLVLFACWLIAGALGARPGYDSSWHLIWAQDLLAGRTPTFDGWAVPTEHPLLVVIAIPAALFGRNSGQALIALDLFALLLIGPALVRLTKATLGSGATGAVAWLIMAGAYGLLLAALRGYLDVWFVLLVVWAAGSVSKRPAGGSGALAIGLSGLLRPEGWLLAATAALACLARGDRRGGVRFGLATLVPPLLWFGIDGLVTGKPLLSFETARTLALEGDGGGPLHVITVSLFGGVRGPATLLGAVGVVLALRVVGPKRIAPQMAVGAVGLAAATLIAVAGLTLLPRYLMLVWLALAIFGGYAIAGWSGLPKDHRLRKAWFVAGVGVSLAGAVGAVGLGAVSKLADEVRIDRSIGSDLGALLETPSIRRGLDCGPVTVPSFRLVPDVILELDDRSTIVRARGLAPKPDTGAAIVVTGESETVRGRYSRPGIDLPVDEDVPAGFMPAGSAGDLSAFVRCSTLSR